MFFNTFLELALFHSEAIFQKLLVEGMDDVVVEKDSAPEKVVHLLDMQND